MEGLLALYCKRRDNVSLSKPQLLDAEPCLRDFGGHPGATLNLAQMCIGRTPLAPMTFLIFPNRTTP